MKRLICCSGISALLVALVAPGVASAQTKDIDYDFMLMNIDTLLQEFAGSFNYPLSGVDNDGNGIREEDSLAMLGAIVRGGARVGAIPDAATIRGDFFYNRSAADADMAVTGTNCTLLGIAGYPCKLTDILRMPGLVPNGDYLAELILDFFGGLTTIADTPQTFNFISNYIDALIDAFGDELPPEIPPSMIEDIANDIKLEAGNYRRWGANGNRPNRLGANGDIDQQGLTNYGEYAAAGTVREPWLENSSISPAPIRITQHPSGGTYYTGEQFNLTVGYAGGQDPHSFKWENAEDYPDAVVGISNGNGIAGATTATLAFEYPLLSHDDMKAWGRVGDTVTFFNPSPFPSYPTGGRTSVFAEIEIVYRDYGIRYQPDPSIGYRNPGQSFSTTFTVWGGNSVPTHQWYKEGSGAVSGQTSNTLNLTNLQLSDEGQYYCIATQGATPLESNRVFLGVRNPMSIVSQPVGANLAAGDDYTFEFEVSDGNPDLSYEWYRVSIGAPPGTIGSLIATGTTTGDPPAMPIMLELTGLAGGDQGEYYCKVTDMAGEEITSDRAVLTVLAILAQPIPQEVKPGFPAIFEITVLEGSGVPFPPPDEYLYQWRIDGSDIGGATAYRYVIASVRTGAPPDGDEGIYTCLVTDAVAVTLESEPAPLIISAAPIEFVVQPEGARKYAGESHNFLTVATGGETGENFTYQWQKDGVDISGATSLILNISSVQLIDQGLYRCEVGETGFRPPLDYAYTVQAFLEVAEPLTIISNPEDANLYEGDAFSVMVGIAGGLGTQMFQWYKGAAALPGETTQTFEIASVTFADAGKYRCDVWDDRGIPLATTFAWLQVFSDLGITQQPANATVPLGDAHLFTIETSGGVGALQYAWTKDGEPVGEDEPVLPIPEVGLENGGMYVCTVMDSEGSIVVSNDAELTVSVEYAITGQPQDDGCYVGGGATFSVNTTGAKGGETYQWYFDSGAKDGVAIPGGTQPTLVIDPATPGDAGLYYVEATDDKGTGDTGDDEMLTSMPAQLLVAEHMGFTVHPISQQVAIGGTASFSVQVSGGLGTLSYGWEKNGAPLPDATDAALVIMPVEQDDEGQYVCNVSDDEETVASNPGALTIAAGTPAAGVLCLSLLAGACALAGAFAIRRKK